MKTKRKKCVECNRIFAYKWSGAKYCSHNCRESAHRKRERGLKTAKNITQTCLYCGKAFVSKRLKEFCSYKCSSEYDWDKRRFGGERRNAIGFDTRTCWICGKTNLKPCQMHVHHVIRAKTEVPTAFVVLCKGCHQLVTLLGNRNFLQDAHKIADLITLARFEKGLDDARTIVEYKYTGERK